MRSQNSEINYKCWPRWVRRHRVASAARTWVAFEFQPVASFCSGAKAKYDHRPKLNFAKLARFCSIKPSNSQWSPQVCSSPKCMLVTARRVAKTCQPCHPAGVNGLANKAKNCVTLSILLLVLAPITVNCTAGNVILALVLLTYCWQHRCLKHRCYQCYYQCSTSTSASSTLLFAQVN